MAMSRKNQGQLTATGISLESRLTSLQGRRFAAAYREAGVDAVDGFQRVLRGLLDSYTIDQIAQQDQASDI